MNSLNHFWPHALSAVTAVNSEYDEACNDIKPVEGWHRSTPAGSASTAPALYRCSSPPLPKAHLVPHKSVRALFESIRHSCHKVMHQGSQRESVRSSIVFSVSGFVALRCFSQKSAINQPLWRWLFQCKNDQNNDDCNNKCRHFTFLPTIDMSKLYISLCYISNFILATLFFVS